MEAQQSNPIHTARAHTQNGMEIEFFSPCLFLIRSIYLCRFFFSNKQTVNL